MKKIKTVVISMLALSILVVGLAAFAGNGFGSGGAVQAGNQTDKARLYLNQYDTDGDGILNCDDPDWQAPMDGTGYGASNGNRQHLGDGSGQGSMQGYGQRLADGSGLGRGNGTGICQAE